MNVIGAEFDGRGLPRGESQLQGWFPGAEGQELCGAFYALMTKLP